MKRCDDLGKARVWRLTKAGRDYLAACSNAWLFLALKQQIDAEKEKGEVPVFTGVMNIRRMVSDGK